MTAAQRLDRLEAFIGERSDDVPNLVSAILAQREQINDLRQALIETRNDLEGRLDAQQDAMVADQRETQLSRDPKLDNLIARVETLVATVLTLEDEVAFVRRAIGRQHLADETPATKVRVPEPKQFGGVRNAKELENFVWDMEQYFKAAKVPDAEQVALASMFLTGDAKLWWRTKMADDHSAGRPGVNGWEAMKKELKDQFLPHNTAWVARESLKKLRHTGTVRDYVKEFSSLMLDITNMSEEDKLFNFLSGLQNWAQAELRRQGVRDIQSAMAAAEGLADFRMAPIVPHGEKKRTVASKPAPPKAGKKKPAAYKKAATEDAAKESKSNPQRSGGCFLCHGPHRMKDCPKREKVSALMETESSDAGEPSRVNPLQSLNALAAKKSPPCRDLLYVMVRINGHEVKAMLDTGATNNFVAREQAHELGMAVGDCATLIKAVNSKAERVHGLAEAAMEIGPWKGTCSFMVIPLDDFKVILGIEFFLKAKVMLMPYLRGMMIYDETAPCFIPTLPCARKQEEQELLTAKQVSRGMRKGCATYVAALVQVEADAEAEKCNAEAEVPDAVGEVLRDYAGLMPAELPKHLPPRRACDHRIELEPGARPPAKAPYRMAPAELAELRTQLDELLEAGMIQPSKAPYGAPVLFQRKQDGKLRMCVDYRALNKVTIKNKYPVPNAADLFDRLAKAKFFTKLDLRSGYWQVRIAAGDEPKTTCVTRYGSFEFRVMPFGLTNAPATFCNLMADVLHEFLDKFVVVYLDDIVVYNNTLEEHVDHLRRVLARLEDNRLYLKREKCEFCRPEILFLGHWIGHGKIRMDGRKVQAILDWSAPTKVNELRSFLGLANYYRRFVQGYSAKVSPLTDLLKKDQKWAWTEACQSAFEQLKMAVSSEPVLQLPNFDQPFEVHTDASDRALGGVLVQMGHPIAYESRKFKDVEQRYSAHEKEMTAVIHCLEAWRHYLLGTRFTIVTDNVANTYFKTQKKLTPKQARWQEFLAEFDFEWVHRPGRQNQVADALSRKEVHEFVAALTTVQSTFMEKIRRAAQEDAAYARVKKEVEDGLVRRFWIEDGLLYARGSRLVVPRDADLRRELLRETHDSRWAGHPGMERMHALLSRSYYWTKMRDDVEAYVRTCQVCQIDKTERRKQAGLLQPLPIPDKPWASISMDFVVGFPEVQGMRSILVVVDRFSKYAIFMAAPEPCTAETTANLFFKHVVKFFGVPADIISDRDARFTGRFWTTLFRFMGSDLKFSTAYHPQTDGQTERINALLEEYLRHYASTTQRNWVELLDAAQFAYNVNRSSATTMSPAEVCLGFQPNTPAEAAQLQIEGPCPAAHRFARDKAEILDRARHSLVRAAWTMKEKADPLRRNLEFKVGDKVLLKITQQLRGMGRHRKLHKGLMQRYDGPFRVVRRVGERAYRLALPERLKIHPTFHVSLLKPYHEDPEGGREPPPRDAPVRKEFDKEIGRILADRTVGPSTRKQYTEYLVQWKGEDLENATWIRAEELWQFEDDIEAYLLEDPTRASAAFSGGGLSRP